MRVHIYLFLCIICSLSACSSVKNITYNADIEANLIREVLNDQQTAWNKGDIGQFMKGYWNNEQLSFIGSKGITRGWAQTLANYEKGYPTKDAMGKLEFEIIELKVLSADAAYMIGKYTLTRENDSPSGYFNLLWNKLDGKWLIASDHTSG